MATPLTTPLLLMLAMPALLLLQTPPTKALLKVKVLPTHTSVPPVMEGTAGNGFTYTNLRAITLPQVVLTVYLMVS